MLVTYTSFPRDELLLDREAKTAHVCAAMASMDGMWVLLVDRDPVMARAGDDQSYLLVFKNVAKAREFVAVQELDGAQPRMVVRGNRDDILQLARSAGASGLLVDYDPATQHYAAASAL